MSPSVGPVARAWLKWKALRLPWRKRYLVGFDLHGNTYWEFKLTREPGERWRRIVKYPRSTHYSSVKVSPLWHQWLRYTRDEPPSMNEQQGDVARQARMKYLAAQADARWEAKPRVMEAPEEVEKVDAPKSEGPDPWAKAKARGPGEEWQPQAWTPASKKS